ncbi:hypothetical protein B4U80_04562 [Leptotrombidium deliense]|uniref:Uncharacterized protein n=1 Tax=Leptotrombidium deliense TaxID=299467 RepID=A0A443Q7N3_9ACAR|nr:hypothetical protein B4U80_04562 [Leptotrombidium deliense]
MSILYRLSTA